MAWQLVELFPEKDSGNTVSEKPVEGIPETQDEMAAKEANILRELAFRDNNGGPKFLKGRYRTWRKK